MKKKTLSKTWVVCILAMFCCFLWGSAFPCIKMGYQQFHIASNDYVTQILFAGIRFTLAGILVILVNSFCSRKFMKPQKPAKIITLSIFQTSLQYTFFYIGLANTTGVKSSIITGAGVFLTMLVASLIFRQEKLTFEKILGSMLGFLGIAIVNLSGAEIDLGISLLGEGFIFLSALTSAFSSAFIKQFSKNTDVVMLSGYQFFVGGLTLSGLGLYLGAQLPRIDGKGALIIGYLAFVSAAAYTIWSILLKYNSVSRVAVFKFMNPLFGVLLSAMILKGETQKITEVTVLALILVCMGILVVNREQGKNRRSKR